MSTTSVQALFEHTAAYDGYGSAAIAEFSTIGAQEVIETLDENDFLQPVLQAALSADMYDDLRLAAGALEVSHIQKYRGSVRGVNWWCFRGVRCMSKELRAFMCMCARVT
jgi:hypothetical protein